MAVEVHHLLDAMVVARCVRDKRTTANAKRLDEYDCLRLRLRLSVRGTVVIFVSNTATPATTVTKKR